jgi:carbon monoxide dehydrogenase subunit G
MQISNESSVHAPFETLWEVLNDIERVAPFVPGFALEEVEGDTYRGTVKIKVGAVTVAYNSEIEVLERDADVGRVVMAVSGRERRGPGSMNANVTSILTAEGDSTKIALTTELQVTGKVAQFGSGVLGDVSASLLNQFIAALEDGVVGAQAATPELSPAAVSANAAGAPQSARKVAPASSASDVVDITAMAGRSLTKRAAPLALGGALIAAIFYALGRRR